MDRPLHCLPLATIREGELTILLSAEDCHWLAVDPEVAWLISQMDGRRSPDDLAGLVAGRRRRPLGWARWWVGLAVAELLEKGVVSHDRPRPRSPRRRAEVLRLDRLNELWLHTNNSCNLTCSHCLVSSGPGADPGLEGQRLLDLLERARELGVRRFYFTGGEPFVRPDIMELIRHVTETLSSELIVITNGTVVRGEVRRQLQSIDRNLLRLQVSLDGTTPGTNDVIRGAGVFARVEEAVRGLVEDGFPVALTSVVGRTNLAELGGLPELAAQWGAGSVHLMWPVRKGRAATSDDGSLPTVLELCKLCDEVAAGCRRHGVEFDNYGSVMFRMNGQPGIRFDLSNAGWDSLFVDRDGGVYPSAVFSQDPAWKAGSILEEDLEAVWRHSPLLEALRGWSQLEIAELSRDPFRWFIGGGDVEHAAHHSEEDGVAALATLDPYYPVYQHLARRALDELAAAGKAAWSSDGGYDGPRIYHVMGDGAIACGTEGVAEAGAAEVQTLHSNCVLSFDVDRPRAFVRAFYGHAAEEPQENLCCPVKYHPDDADHIPQEVLDRFYGCGSPVADAGISAGETVVDLGCGAGIDCFIAARKVGPTGRVIGVDMTDEMLAVARENRPIVADRLGFDVVDFRKGFLETIPVGDGKADLVISNCVVNLSPDKRRVFREIYRVLGVLGRVVISDIVCEASVPPHLRVQEHLWGECLSGALSEGEFLRGLLKAGFYGVTVLKRTFWRQVQGYAFYSVTVAGYRWPPAEREARGEIAIYRGPFAEAIDDDGRSYPRGVPVEVDHAAAERLRTHPYDRLFQVLRSDEEALDTDACCLPGGAGGC